MPNRILAVDLEGDHIAAVLVETSFRSYRFVHHVAVDRDAKRSLPDQLRELVAAHHLESDMVLSALPGRSATCRILELPFRDRRKIQQTVPFEIESQVPIALEDAIVDFQVLAKTDSGTRVFAALAPRDAIRDHLAMLAEAGLDPAVVDYAPLSTLNVLQLFEGDRPERYALLHVRGGQATLALLSGGDLQGLRVLDVGHQALPQDVARGIRWTLRAFQAPEYDPGMFDGLPLLVVGTISDDTLAELSGVGFRVQRLEDLPLRHVPDELRRTQGTFAAAIGLALREIAEHPTVGLDFRREELTYHRGRQEIRRNLARLGSLATVAFILFLISNLVSYQALSGRYESLRQAVRKVFVTTLPNETVILDETLQLSQAIAGLRQRTQPGGAVGSALEALREMSILAPREPRINAGELTFNGETLHLRGETDSFEAVEAIKTRLATSDLFREVQVRDPHTNPKGRVEFRLTLLLSAGGER